VYNTGLLWFAIVMIKLFVSIFTAQFNSSNNFFISST